MYIIGDLTKDYWIGAKRYVAGGSFEQTFGAPINDSSPLWQSGSPSSSAPDVCALAVQNSDYRLLDQLCMKPAYVVCQIEHSY